MFSDIVGLDQRLTVAINQCHAPWADVFMHTLSKTATWIPLYILLVGLIIYAYRKPAWIVIVAVVLLVGLADWTSVHFFKETIMRFRPSHEPALDGLVRLPYGKGGFYGFISSHAANCFAIAAYVSFALRRRFKVFNYGILYLWAALIAYSRVYLARHYVGDVLCGALWGVFLALLLWILTRLTLAKAYPSEPRFLYSPPKK
ncbi:MAG: phosphatase PAP2 family protein [Lentimicrobiaceae bacterium]|nr:phosphatase PAP2 family protein [Lentimicrobiaceae bacterium]